MRVSLFLLSTSSILRLSDSLNSSGLLFALLNSLVSSLAPPLTLWWSSCWSRISRQFYGFSRTSLRISSGLNSPAVFSMKSLTELMASSSRMLMIVGIIVSEMWPIHSWEQIKIWSSSQFSKTSLRNRLNFFPFSSAVIKSSTSSRRRRNFLLASLYKCLSTVWILNSGVYLKKLMIKSVISSEFVKPEKC